MSKPEWVNKLGYVWDSYSIGEGVAWQITLGDEYGATTPRGLDLGQFADGKWFSGPCAGDSASEAIARHYLQICKATLDAIDDALRLPGSGYLMFSVGVKSDQLNLLHWYQVARRAELNRNP